VLVVEPSCAAANASPAIAEHIPSKTQPGLGVVKMGDRITWQGISAHSIYEVVEAYGKEVGAFLAPTPRATLSPELAHRLPGCRLNRFRLPPACVTQWSKHRSNSDLPSAARPY
jgi:hypothetical protein